jgi:NADH-quinone oxidoreductase subunit G
VQVEKAPKPLPACATPVTNGMKVWTHSKTAVDAQKGVMEFLLINHPLDCPICDQGGECQLQDLAVGYGGSSSRYDEPKRVVPRENESINETWLADRDRFSYEAVYSDERLLAPQIKHAGEWCDIGWEGALAAAADAIRKAAADKVGLLASPWITVEEAHLLSGIASYVGTSNIDYRIRCRDFADQENDPLYPWLGCEIAAVEQQDAILVVGSNIRAEAPILAHRVRKAALAGAEVSFVNSAEHEYFFDVANSLTGRGLVEMLAGVAVAACGTSLPATVAALCAGIGADAGHEKIAASLRNAERALVLLGNVAGRHRAMSAVRALAAAIANATGARFGTLSEGPNSAGAALAGVLPHRGLGGVQRAEPGLHAGDMPGAKLDVLMLVNVEPDVDILATDDVAAKMRSQQFTVALTPFVSESLLDAADLLLPIGTFAESSGTYVNVAGTWQSFPGIANPVGEARPAWKVLRVIGNLLGAPGFEYVSSAEVLAELREQLGDALPDNTYPGTTALARPKDADAVSGDIDIPIYSTDPVVRRARALQLTDAARRARGEGGER